MLKIRVDDFPYTKNEEQWRHNLVNFKRFDEVMARYVPEYILGVIPKHTSKEDLDYLSSNPRIMVAMHGIEHDERFPNEFREWQTEKDIGQAIMSVKGIWDELVGPIDTYIPPHNVIDQKTVRALKSTGFKQILGGPGTDVSVLEYANSLDLDTRYSLPPHFYGRSDELLAAGAPEEIRHVMGSFYDHYLSLHWTWEQNIGFENLNKFLTEICKE